MENSIPAAAAARGVLISWLREMLDESFGFGIKRPLHFKGRLKIFYPETQIAELTWRRTCHCGIPCTVCRNATVARSPGAMALF